MPITGMSTGRGTVGVDIGGSRVRAAVVTASGHVLGECSAATPRRAPELQQTIVDQIAGLAARWPVTAVGLAVAGFVSADRGSVMFAPHLPWRDTPVPRIIADAVHLPVVMDHDVNCAAWAEYRLGAAAGVAVSLTVALGTGIGAGLIAGGRLYRGAGGVAPELGHLTVIPDGRCCPCGRRGCLERYCSGTALAVDAGELAAARTGGGVINDPRSAGQPTGADIARAARAGDPVALASFARLAHWLGVGLGIACDVLDPEVIVIAGGVAESADLYLDAARAEMIAQMTGSGYRPVPRVTVARFGAAAAMIGAALMAVAPTEAA